MDEIRPVPNGGLHYQPVYRPGNHWISGRQVWKIYRLQEERRRLGWSAGLWHALGALWL